MKSYFQNINFFSALLYSKEAAIFICVSILLFATLIPAQTDTVIVPSDISPAEGNLNNCITERINSGTLSNTVFKLEPYGYYILTDSIVVPKEEHLTIVAPEPGNTPETALPQLISSSNMGGSKSYIFKVFGDLTLKNIWLLYANRNGWQVPTPVSFISDSLNERKQYGNFEGVIGINEPVISRPVHFKLYQNYPNPFNSTTQVKYSIPENSYISLKVYNLLGEEVATLFEGFQRSGNHTITFNATGLASGVYFYWIKAGDFISSRKLILLK